MRPPPPRRRWWTPCGSFEPQAHDIQTRTRKGFRYANAHPHDSGTDAPCTASPSWATSCPRPWTMYKMSSARSTARCFSHLTALCALILTSARRIRWHFARKWTRCPLRSGQGCRLPLSTAENARLRTRRAHGDGAGAWPQDPHEAGASAQHPAAVSARRGNDRRSQTDLRNRGLERLRVKAVFRPAPLAGSFCRDDRRFARPHDGARSAEVTFTAEGRCAHFCSAASGRDALAACVAFYSRAAALPLPQAPQSLLGFGRMEAGSVRNAVAGSARLEGTLRALDDAAFCSIREALETISRHVAQSSGCAATVHFSEGYPAVVNPPDLLRRASALFPIEALTAPSMASDDFFILSAAASRPVSVFGLRRDIGAARRRSILTSACLRPACAISRQSREERYGRAGSAHRSAGSL